MMISSIITSASEPKSCARCTANTTAKGQLAKTRQSDVQWPIVRLVFHGLKPQKRTRLQVKPKIYFYSFYAYARVHIQYTWCKCSHQHSTHFSNRASSVCADCTCTLNQLFHWSRPVEIKTEETEQCCQAFVWRS